MTFTSSPGDLLGLGQTRRYTLADGAWRTQFVEFESGRQRLTVIMSTQVRNASYWTLDFSPPQGQRLAVGTYEEARVWPHGPPTQPSLQFALDSSACGTLTGRFVVMSLKFGPGNTVDRFHATFETHCVGASPGLTGEISVVADPWR